MHSDLAGHLHSSECNHLIDALKQCHKTHTFGRFLGYCNDANSVMLRCLTKEREARRKANHEKSIATNKRIHQKSAESTSDKV